MVVEAVVPPVVPAHTLHCAVGQGGGQQGRAYPRAGEGRSGNLCQDGRYEWLEPSRVAADVRTVQARLQSLPALALQIRVQRGVSQHVHRHAPEDEEERVRHEGCGGLGEAQGPAQVGGEDGLRGVVCHGQACGHAHDVLCARAPPLTSHLTADELVAYAVVHLLSGVLDEVGQEVCKHVGHEGGAHRHEERASLGRFCLRVEAALGGARAGDEARRE
mmetsp:Transcript_19491/g.42266  ORF Transcript_19491/g.42266 Transcript_19491/m.42266 type:complete len:218 (-) Transcript_19491:30-683(-)